MENVNQWIESSLFLKIITFFFKPEIYQGSLFYNGISTISDFISGALKGSRLWLFFTHQPWEREAVKQSHFMSSLQKSYSPVEKLVEFLNTIIKNSFPFKIILLVEKSFIDAPFATLSYIVLPGMLINAVLTVIVGDFTLKALVLQIVLISLLFFMSFIRVSLQSLLISSGVWSILAWVFDENSIKNSFKKQNCISDLSHKAKLIFKSIGIAGGILYYFLPVTTFVKLIGLIFFSTIIYIWPWVGLAVMVFILPLAATTYSVAIIGLTFLSIILNHKKFKFEIPAAMIPALLFMAAAGIAALFSVLRAESLKTLPLYAAYFMVFYSASVLLKNRKIMKVVIISITVSTFILSIYGIYQYFFVKIPTAAAWVDVKQFPEIATRVYATLENPNVLGEYLGLVIPLIIGVFWATGKFRQKPLIVLVLAVMTLCLILTFSRGAWVGLAMSVLAFALLKEPRLLVLILALAVISPMFLPSVVTNRIASIGSLEDSSNAFRVTIWIAVLRMIKDYWLTGVGLGLNAFSRVYRDYMIAGAPAVHAHNLYLEVGLEMGILGLLALLWMVFRGFSEALVGIENNYKTSYILAGIMAALAGHLLHGLFDYVWYSPRIVLTFWMFFGMMAALSGHDTAVER